MTGQAVDVEVAALVVGSGISGSCTAWNLLKNQGVANVLLVERNPVVGGDQGTSAASWPENRLVFFWFGTWHYDYFSITRSWRPSP